MMTKNSLPISRKKAVEILTSMPQTDFDMAHYLMSEAVMRGVAHKLKKDEDYWGMVGLLHDIDWALTKNDVQNHCVKCVDMLKKEGFDQHFIDIVQSHGFGYENIPKLKNEKRWHDIEHALVASETLTGLIYAYALMRDGRVSDMTVKGLKKKFKDKTFAKGVNRDFIEEIDEVGIPLSDFLQIGIDSIRGIKSDIGLF